MYPWFIVSLPCLESEVLCDCLSPLLKVKFVLWGIKRKKYFFNEFSDLPSSKKSKFLNAKWPAACFFTPCSLLTLSLTVVQPLTSLGGWRVGNCLCASSSLSLTHCRFLLQWHRLCFVIVPNLTSFFHFFCPQGKTPSPRAAHACATVGNRGFVFGGRYRVSPSTIYQCAAGAQMENFNLSLLYCRSPEWTTFTTWTWIRGSGMKCRY